jgi:adenylate cyclase
VLVTDICKSTEIASRLGDQRWLGVLQTHNALIREQIHRHHGTEVKAQGDGFLVTFTSARQAVLAAIAIQRAMAEFRRAHPDNPIDVRVGVHTGEVVEDHGDVIGQNVILAVRIADAAAPGEILVSSLTKDLTDAGGDLGYDDGREAELKGVSRAWRLHAVAWA